ncbi:MAG: C40 family peptidase [Burkholderiales bacterium]|nr:C40 family peptidase [Burkholderiales bacterium]
MPMPPTRLHRIARHTAACTALVILSTTALAAPEVSLNPPSGAASAAADPVSRFLLEKGLVGPVSEAIVPASNAFVERMRDKASDMVLTALNFLGVPYRRGGNSAAHGFDCSGFTRQVFETSLGLLLPRRADEQAHAPGLVAVQRSDLQPGDLVFFNTLRRTFSHVGIYLGDGKFIHAPRPGGEVRVEDMRFSYWARRFTGARRAEPALEQAAADEAAAPPSTLKAVQAVR